MAAMGTIDARDELRQSILRRRHDITVDFSPRPILPLTPGEIEKERRRKESNRRSAQRSRLKLKAEDERTKKILQQETNRKERLMKTLEDKRKLKAAMIQYLLKQNYTVSSIQQALQNVNESNQSSFTTKHIPCNKRLPNLHQLGINGNVHVPSADSHQLGINDTMHVPSADSRQLGIIDNVHVPSADSHQLGINDNVHVPSADSHQLGINDTMHVPSADSRQLGINDNVHVPSSDSHQLCINDTVHLPSADSRQLGIIDNVHVPSIDSQSGDQIDTLFCRPRCISEMNVAMATRNANRTTSAIFNETVTAQNQSFQYIQPQPDSELSQSVKDIVTDLMAFDNLESPSTLPYAAGGGQNSVFNGVDESVVPGNTTFTNIPTPGNFMSLMDLQLIPYCNNISQYDDLSFYVQ